MTLIKVKTKYQVTIPGELRKQVGVAVGDVLEAKVEKGRILLTPKSIVDRAIAEGLEDLRKGRVYGPFNTVDEMLASLKGKARKRKLRAQ